MPGFSFGPRPRCCENCGADCQSCRRATVCPAQPAAKEGIVSRIVTFVVILTYATSPIWFSMIIVAHERAAEAWNQLPAQDKQAIATLKEGIYSAKPGDLVLDGDTPCEIVPRPRATRAIAPRTDTVYVRAAGSPVKQPLPFEGGNIDDLEQAHKTRFVHVGDSDYQTVREQFLAAGG